MSESREGCKPTGPFCWQHKADLDRICEGVEGDGVAAATVAVWVALSWIAADEGRGTFTATLARIGRKCGLSVRSVQRRLADLERLGLLTVSTPALRSPCTYTITTLDAQRPPLPSGHNDRTSGHNGLTFGHGEGSGLACTKRTERTVSLSPEGGGAVDLPPGFPQTEADARAHAAFVGCPPDFAVTTWRLAMSRGGRDAKDVPIRNWRMHLRANFDFQQSREAEQLHKGQPPHAIRKPNPSVQRNERIHNAGAVDHGAIARAIAAKCRSAS